MLTLFDARGRVMARTNDFDGQADPLIAFTPPADGRYIVRVGDLMLAGSAEHFYRLSIGAFPYVTAVYPLSVPANQETQVELIGYNLPAEQKVAVKAGAVGRSARAAGRSRKPAAAARRKCSSARCRRAWRRSRTTSRSRRRRVAAPGTVNGRLDSA